MTKLKFLFISTMCLCIMLFSANSGIAENGVTATEIVVGQSAALTGPAAALGIELKAGAQAYFDKINNAGGIHGRKIKLVSYDDGYEPNKCIENTRKLIDEDLVFVLFGYVGTPTTKAAISIIDEAGIPLVGPFTGAGFLRDPTHKVFNIRGTYDQETGGLVAGFHKDLGLKKIACLYQNDAYGKVGLAGVEKGLAAEGLELAGSANYERNTVAVKGAVAKMKKIAPDAIIMIGAYKPCAAFIKLSKQIGIESKFANISFVGTSKLINEMGEAGEGTYISQVVKSPADTSIPYIAECAELLGRQPTYGEVEGFLDAKVLVQGLQDAGAELTRSAFVQSMESLTMDIGGAAIAYSSSDHQGMDDIYFTKVVGGEPKPIEKLE